MSIFVNRDTRVLVQGITGSQGLFHTEKMLEYGTRVVGGVTPGKGGQAVLGLPVFDTVEQAVEELRAILCAEHCKPAERMELILNGKEM